MNFSAPRKLNKNIEELLLRGRRFTRQGGGRDHQGGGCPTPFRDSSINLPRNTNDWTQ